MKIKVLISILALTAATIMLSSCSKSDDSKTTEITYSLSKFVCTDGSGNEHKLASNLKQQLENGCTVCKGKDTGSAKKYLNSIVDTFAIPENTPYSYDITVSYTAEQPGFFNWKETLK